MFISIDDIPPTPPVRENIDLAPQLNRNRPSFKLQPRKFKIRNQSHLPPLDWRQHTNNSRRKNRIAIGINTANDTYTIYKHGKNHRIALNVLD